MPFRLYPTVFKRGNKSYKGFVKKWIKSNTPYRPQKRGQAKPMYSTRFGFIDLYTRKERDEVKCPSGYTIGQCLGSLRKNWLGYHAATNDEKSLERVKYYAKRIQNNQKDLGLKTTSFPHLAIYGDVFILNNKKGKRVVFEDHSALKEKQEAFEKWQAENSKKIQEKLQRPDKEKGEAIQTFADDVSPGDMDFVFDLDDDEIVPDLLEPDEEKGEERITMTDDIPFKSKNKN